MIPRLMKLFTAPGQYWSEVVAEPGDIKTLLVPQMLILAAIPALAQFLGTVFGFMRFGFGAIVGAAFVGLILGYLLSIGMWIAFGFVIDALATPFGAQRDIGQSMKLATGAVIPGWLGGALSLTTVPALGMVGSLAGMGYGAYLLYLGLPIMNGTAPEKAVGYTAASIGILFAIGLVTFFLVSCPIGCLMASALRPF